MEMVATGLGLSSSAGLNAYLPLIIYNLAIRFDLLPASDTQIGDTITSWEALGLFTLLLIVEMIVDKVPLLDSVNDVVGTVIRPVAGAILMMASTGELQETLSPEMVQLFALISGGSSAGGVHAVKAFSRPLVTGSTAGTGNFAVSFLEDVLAVGVSLFAIVLPFIILFMGIGLVLLGFWYIWELQRRDMVQRQYLKKT